MRRFALGVLLLFCGILVLPLCAAASWAVLSLVLSVRPASYQEVPWSAWALVLGFVSWLGIFFVLPRPFRTYVLAHELTHALWAYLTGVKVGRVKVSKSGGSVQLSENNIIITLAPYFFPLYTVILILLYYSLSIFYDMSGYELLWLTLVGFTWGFHLTFTIAALLQHQSDIREYGRLLSYSLIYLLNVLGVGCWIVIVSSATIEQFASFLVASMAGLLSFARHCMS